MSVRLLAAILLPVATWVVATGDGPLGGSDDGPVDDLASLVAAERAFAGTSVDRGMRTAFLTWLAEQAVVFRPQPVDARAWFEARPEFPGTLLWEPAYAEISPAGDMGWTTGPYEFRPAAEGQPSGYGHYVSVWGRRPDGSWRVLVDHGTPHPQEIKAERLEFPAHNRRTAPRRNARADTALTVEALLEADRRFAGAAERHGARRAYLAVATEGVRLYRNGELPAVGRGAISATFGRRATMLRWTPQRAGASVSGTLGYTIGRVDFGSAAEEDGAYLRIWRREDNRWKLVVDILPDTPTKQEQ